MANKEAMPPWSKGVYSLLIGQKPFLRSKRWPVILTNVISTIYNVNHKADSSSDGEAKVEEGKQIIAKISALKSGMGKNAIMELVIGSTTLSRLD